MTPAVPRSKSERKGLQRRHIAALVAVGESLSVHAAARELGIPQPALSRVLSEAEKLLGSRVFDRSSHGCTPTLDGQMVLAQARFVMRGLEELGSGVADTRPTVRLGCIPRAMHTLIPRLLNLVYPETERSAKSSPGPTSFRGLFKLDVMEGSSTELIEKLNQGKLDFAILRSTSRARRIESTIDTTRMYDDRIVVVCTAENTDLGERAIPLRSLASRDWVLPDTRATSRQAFDDFFREHGLAPVKPIMEVRSFEANLALVAGTRFLSIAPESIANRYATMGLRVVRTRPALPSSPVLLAYPRGELSPARKNFYDLLIQAAAGY